MIDILYWTCNSNTYDQYCIADVYYSFANIFTIIAINYRDFLFSGSSDNNIKVWNIRNTLNIELVHTIKGHDDPVCSLACTENLVFSGSLKAIKVA